jgi:C-terminal processing protease CtpA/Prc
MTSPETLMHSYEQVPTLIPPDLLPYRARLCQMNQWPGFTGYGFNLHSNNSDENLDHFVGRVDENSPASAAGLLMGDRIVEVNGVNVGTLTLILIILLYYIFFDNIFLFYYELFLLIRNTITHASC